jgi:hypothetical protein
MTTIEQARQVAINAAREYLAALEQSEPIGEIVADDMGRPFNAVQIRTHFYKEVPAVGTKLYTTSPPAQRKPLTREQRVDLLAKFEAHKYEWHASSILIDMVEAAHGIKENK